MSPALLPLLLPGQVHRPDLDEPDGRGGGVLLAQQGRLQGPVHQRQEERPRRHAGEFTACHQTNASLSSTGTGMCTAGPGGTVSTMAKGSTNGRQRKKRSNYPLSARCARGNNDSYLGDWRDGVPQGHGEFTFGGAKQGER